MKILSFCLSLWMIPLFAGPLVAGDTAPEDDTEARLDAITQRLTGPTYQLQYKFRRGETIRTKVSHQVAIETKIQASRQTAKTRSISTKAWRVEKVDDQGRITFVHQVDDVDMWNKISGVEEVRYNSKTDKEPPVGYQSVADSVGVPLSEVTIDPAGTVIRRNDKRKMSSLGGQIVAPLPVEPVRIGAKWYAALDVAAKLPGGVVKRIKTRQQYTLEKVEDNLATISIHTQVLTPVTDPKVKVQLVQRLTHGEMTFDLAAGRVTRQELKLDETVIGFNGAESIMQYAGQFTEELLPAGDRTAAGPQQETPPEKDKTEPALRR